MSNEGNQIKNRLLGQSHGAASNRLRKMLLWQLVVETSKDVCFRCGQQIKDIDDLSIEHKEPWQGADDPKAVFFDLENIAFSHLSCNSGAANRERTHCFAGHEYTLENTSERFHEGRSQRVCRTCQRENSRQFHARHPEQYTSAYKRNRGWT